MRRTAAGFLFGFCLAAAIAAAPSESSANKLDLAIGRFISCTETGYCHANIADYERFLAEYFWALTPKLLAPADTLGYSGFYMGLESTATSFPDWNLPATQNPSYFATGPANDKPDAMFVPSIHVRKGLPWSFELGGSINYLAQSEVVGIGGEVKWSLFEGYLKGFRGGLPNLAARGSVVRIIGTTDLDVTIVGVDGSISRPFAIGGQITLTPYAGYQYVWTCIRTEPITYFDGADFQPMDAKWWDTTMLSGPNLGRQKLFLGVRLKYELLSIVVEGAWGLEQEWATAIVRPGDCANPAGCTLEEAGQRDAYNAQRNTKVGHQFQFNSGIGLDF
jgi:hypothetical protein